MAYSFFHSDASILSFMFKFKGTWEKHQLNTTTNLSATSSPGILWEKRTENDASMFSLILCIRLGNLYRRYL